MFSSRRLQPGGRGGLLRNIFFGVILTTRVLGVFGGFWGPKSGYTELKYVQQPSSAARGARGATKKHIFRCDFDNTGFGGFWGVLGAKIGIYGIKVCSAAVVCTPPFLG